jgi:hypothetical protein
MKLMRVAMLAAILAGLSSTNALAAEQAQVNAGFAPENPGKKSTVTIGFQIGSAEGPDVTHLTNIALRLPNGVTNGFNTLGPETCDVTKLELQGVTGCPSNSVVGIGNAVVSVRLGAGQVLEQVKLVILMARAKNEQTELLFYSLGTKPVISQLVFKALLLGDSKPFGALIESAIPPIPALPGEPDAALISLQAVIAPKSLLYHKREHGVTVAYAPEGFDTPPKCPQGGYPFAATLTFASGAKQSASTRVPCAHAKTAHRAKRRRA